MIEVKLRNTKLDSLYILDDPEVDYLVVGFADGDGGYRPFNNGSGTLVFHESEQEKEDIIPFREYLERAFDGPMEDGMYAGRDSSDGNYIFASYNGEWFDIDGYECNTLFHATVTDRIGDIPPSILKGIKEYLEDNR